MKITKHCLVLICYMYYIKLINSREFYSSLELGVCVYGWSDVFDKWLQAPSEAPSQAKARAVLVFGCIPPPTTSTNLTLPRCFSAPYSLQKHQLVLFTIWRSPSTAYIISLYNFLYLFSLQRKFQLFLLDGFANIEEYHRSQVGLQRSELGNNVSWSNHR